MTEQTQHLLLCCVCLTVMQHHFFQCSPSACRHRPDLTLKQFDTHTHTHTHTPFQLVCIQIDHQAQTNYQQTPTHTNTLQLGACKWSPGLIENLTERRRSDNRAAPFSPPVQPVCVFDGRSTHTIDYSSPRSSPVTGSAENPPSLFSWARSLVGEDGKSQWLLVTLQERYFREVGWKNALHFNLSASVAHSSSSRLPWWVASIQNPLIYLVS